METRADLGGGGREPAAEAELEKIPHMRQAAQHSCANPISLPLPSPPPSLREAGYEQVRVVEAGLASPQGGVGVSEVFMQSSM